MKLKNLLFATMLCGVFGVFTACSDDDPVTQEPEASTEGVETILAYSFGVNNGVATRTGDVKADDEPVIDEIETTETYLFEVKDEKTYGDLLYYMKNGKEQTGNDENGDPIFTNNSLQKGDDGNYNLPPMKFKVSPKPNSSTVRLAMVVLANVKIGKNYVGAVDNYNELVNRTKSAIISANIGLANTPYDETPSIYPMSSNVNEFDVAPGAINAIGMEEDEAKELVKEAFSVEGLDYSSRLGQPIPLYRLAAEVELATITFGDYSPTQKFKHFVLENVFMMNVPEKISAFNVEDVSIWGANLNENFKDYLKKNEFLSGDNENDINVKLGSGMFRNKEIANKTKIMGSFDFQNFGDGNFRGDEPSNFAPDKFPGNFYGQFVNATKYEMKKKIENSSSSSAAPNIRFTVAPSNYGVSETSKAICLVVKGRYFYEQGGKIFGPDKSKKARYYTVIVNKEGEGSYEGVGVHSNEVRRNVKYNIDLTINGPGSDTPWDHDENAYVTAKLKVVPFGKVIQNSTID